MLARLFAVVWLSSSIGCAVEEEARPQSDGPLYEEDSSSADELNSTHAVANLTSVAAQPVLRTVDQDLAPLPGYEGGVARGRTVAVLREVVIDRRDARVVVDVESLVSAVVAVADLETNSHEAAEGEGGAWLAAHRARAEAPAAYEALANPHTEAGAERISMTIDMCQSSRPWDRRFYDLLSELGRATGRPLPIGVAMTGGWARRHQTELRELLTRNGDSLAIEWVNHSNTHPLHCQGARCDFMTHSSVSTEQEVLGLEKVLLGVGEVPGALFRFPGLMHDVRRLNELNQLGLFALDANAWLAKGQMPAPGAVILVHGNGNEPPGIQKGIAWLEANREAIVAGDIQLVGPRAVIAVDHRE